MTNETPPLNPVTGHRRIVALDTLRGLCMLGILEANLPSLAIPGAHQNPYAASHSISEKLAFGFHSIFIDLKLMTCFAILFGVGLALQFQRAEAKSTPRPKTLGFLAWRLGLLGIIGFVHGCGIWYGDIVLVYAACGAATMLFLLVPKEAQLALASAGIGMTAAFFLLAALASWQQPASLPSILKIQTDLVRSSPTGSAELWQSAWLQSPHWTDYVQWNQLHWIGLILLEAILYSWRLAGLILLGYALVNFDLFRKSEWSNKIWSRILWIVFPICLIIEAIIALGYLAPARLEGRRMLYYTIHQLAAIGVSLGYFAIILRLPERLSLNGWLAGPNRVGRMALSVYISESFVQIFLFSGLGLGLAGTVGFKDIAVISLGLSLCYCALALIWMQVFQFGPIEWLWRTLAYRKLQPIFKRA